MSGPPEPRSPRRSILVGLLALASVLLIVVAVGVFAWLRSDTRPQAGPTITTQPTGTPTAAAPTSSAPAPDGRLAGAQLRDSTLDVPVWPSDNMLCPAGRTTFADMKSYSGVENTPSFRAVSIWGTFKYGDLDRDGAQETVTVLSCLGNAEADSRQVVALDRDSSGAILTLGTVTATTGDVRIIDFDATSVLPDGSISVRVGDNFEPNAMQPTNTRWQTRTYAWDGHQFRQIAGPTAFPPKP